MSWPDYRMGVISEVYSDTYDLELGLADGSASAMPGHHSRGLPAYFAADSIGDTCAETLHLLDVRALHHHAC